MHNKFAPKFIAIAVCIALSAQSLPSHASGAVAGSTEFTQVTSWVQNFKNFTDQINNLRQQLETVRNTLDISRQMREQLSSVTGLVRDAQSIGDTIREMRDMRNQVQNAFGALDDLKNFSEARFSEISRFKDQFGNRRSVEDYFVQAMRENAREHKMNQVLRDQEAGAIKRLEKAGEAIRQHSDKIPSTVGVHQAVSLMSTQINNLAAMTADVNKIQAIRAAKQTDVEDRRLADQKRDVEDFKDRTGRAQKEMDDVVKELRRASALK
jgi:hypothetical protein